MRANQIMVGELYAVRVSGNIVPVRVLSVGQRLSGFAADARTLLYWMCRNEETGRTIMVKSPQRFRWRVK